MEDYNVLPDEMQSGAPTEGKRRKAGETTTTTVVSANPLELRQAEGMAQATVAIEERRAASEVVAQVQAAMMFPRSFSDVKMRLKDLCGQVSVAEKAVYSYSRGGTSVSGPSIRIAELVAQSYRNLNFGVRELVRGKGCSEMQVYCWDLESNYRAEKNFIVEHKRDTKGGSSTVTASRDIYEIIANEGSRRLRSVIFQVVPHELVDFALDECKKTLTNEYQRSLEKRKQDMLILFAERGVTKAHIEAKFKKPVALIHADDLVELRGIFSAIKDGVAKIDDYFNDGVVKSDSLNRQAQSYGKPQQTTAFTEAADELPD